MTAQQTAATAIRRSITVAAPVEKTFAVFTDRFAAWWPLDYHTGDQDPETVVIEPRRGGRWVRAHCRRRRGRLGRCAGVGAADSAGPRLAT
jgi:hypothetical protein